MWGSRRASRSEATTQVHKDRCSCSSFYIRIAAPAVYIRIRAPAAADALAVYYSGAATVVEGVPRLIIPAVYFDGTCNITCAGT